MREITKLEPTIRQIPTRKKVAAYARVSSGKDEMLHSLAAQVSYYSKLIQSRPDWEYCGVFADEAETGTKDTRAEFQRLLADCRAGKVQMVLTKSISRFARNTVTMLETVRELKTIGVDVYFERENIHSISGDGELMLTILASFAQEESLSASENCKWRIKKRFEQGEPVGFYGMYGYDFIKGEIIVNEEQAAVVRRIFDWYIAGEGTQKIANRLNRAEIPAQQGGRWSGTRVCDLIKNEKLTGNCILQKKFSENHLTKRQVRNIGQLPRYFAEKTHPAIIDSDTFEWAQKIREARAAHVKAGDTSQNAYPYTSKIVCGHCGKNYRRKAVQGRYYWQCGTFLTEGRGSCPAQQIPERVLDDFSADLGGIANITEIFVPEPNVLVFRLNGGQEVRHEWQITRRDSWTDEMKEAARQRALSQHREGKTQ
jgi:DNA invertase Pin-like site-specific DNA recombinase